MIPILNQEPVSVKGPKKLACAVCGETSESAESRMVRCNVRQYRDQYFRVDRCAHCQSLQTQRVNNLAEYYANYPIREQKLGFFFRVWYGVILEDLVKAGLKKEHTILDYGCNQGLFLDFLRERGYVHSTGFDPYVPFYNNPATLQRQYDWVISMDTIEHDEDPVGFFRRLNGLRKSSGRLCVTTPRAEGINLKDADGHLHMLHVPYHVNVLSEKALVRIGREEGVDLVSRRDTFYMDSWQPATSYAFIASLMAYGGNDVDLGYEPPRIDLFFKHPSLLVKLFLGYFTDPKKKDHMTMVFGGRS
ncbi:MAG: class I SAM-dependent methyltransferase [Elusimicrobia bacterium]|nr:class I SAM-dependent methyltransferase [Elusimicrobiota bacterium]